ncbi:MAG: hypothetical protein ACYCWW_21180 [Deltaproteobacteria bacterium]
MRLKVLYHDRCFDGLASAAVFTRFFREKVRADAEVAYQGLAHQSGQVFPPGSFDGDENVVVDFRYSADPRLTWWFDHHQSAFPTAVERTAFEADRSGQKFFDPKAKSCTKFLCDTVVQKFGFDASPLAELVHWAEIIDGALFPSAQAAVELEEPALRLMVAIEGSEDAAQRHRIIGQMQHRSISEIVSSPDVAGPLKALLGAHRQNVELVRAAAGCEGRVVLFDLTDRAIDNFNKFISYYLFPEARYSIGITSSPSRAKISVGSNPWRPGERTHDLSKICERFGGGGHAVVGAISLPPGEVARAREIAREIARELQS